MNKKVIIWILIGIIVAGGVAYAATLRKVSVITSPTTANTITTPQPSVSATTNTQTQPTAIATTPSKDCGTDINCLIAQAKTCGPASVEFTATILKGITGTSHIVIGKSPIAGSCTFNERTDKVVVRGNEDTSSIGTTIACSAVSSSTIAATLTKWNESTFSSEDFINGPSCKTTLPKALTDAMAQQDNTPTPPVEEVNGPHEVFTGLGEGSDIAGNSYQMYIVEVTNNSATLQMRDSNGDNPSTTVMLALNAPQNYFGHSFTLTSVKYDYDEYIGTITVDQL